MPAKISEHLLRLMEAEYVNDESMTYQAIADRHGIDLATVKRYGARRGWAQKKLERQQQITAGLRQEVERLTMASARAVERSAGEVIRELDKGALAPTRELLDQHYARDAAMARSADRKVAQQLAHFEPRFYPDSGFPLSVGKVYGDRATRLLEVKAKMEGLEPALDEGVAPEALRAMTRWAVGAGLLSGSAAARSLGEAHE